MLKIDHITMIFGGLIANNDICTEIDKGEIFGLIGPNGAGKTTLFNVVSGFYKPTYGRIFFKGDEIQGLSSDKIAYKGIARTYQNINLFKKMTVLDNVLTGCHTQTTSGLFDAVFRTEKSRREMEYSLAVCHEALRFMKIDHLQNSVAGSLPYGDQRKLEMARALVGRPELLLLDEPAAGMNLSEKDELAEIILRIRDSGYTVFIVEHHMKLVMNICDKICVLNHGVKIAEGSPKTIQENPDVVEAYLGGNSK